MVSTPLTKTAACICPSLGESCQARLPFVASSTTAQLAALRLAADILDSHSSILSYSVPPVAAPSLLLGSPQPRRSPVVPLDAARAITEWQLLLEHPRVAQGTPLQLLLDKGIS
ncbi:uncharacterized protein LOC144103899 isoform X4 [Amblyomma americanum]